jgi:hypothetical protein
MMQLCNTQIPYDIILFQNFLAENVSYFILATQVLYLNWDFSISVIQILFCSYESRPNGGFSVFYTLPETAPSGTAAEGNAATGTAERTPTVTSDRLAKLIREVKKNVAGKVEYREKTSAATDGNIVSDKNEDTDDLEDDSENDSEDKEVKPATSEKKKSKKPDGGYREDYYEDGSYNEDYYTYSDPTLLDGPPDKSGTVVQEENFYRKKSNFI